MDSRARDEAGGGDAGNRDPCHHGGNPEVPVVPALPVSTPVAVPVDAETMAQYVSQFQAALAQGVGPHLLPLSTDSGRFLVVALILRRRRWASLVESHCGRAPVSMPVARWILMRPTRRPARVLLHHVAVDFRPWDIRSCTRMAMMYSGLPMLGYAAPDGSVRHYWGPSGAVLTGVATASAFTPSRLGTGTEPTVSGEAAPLVALIYPTSQGSVRTGVLLVPRRNAGALDPQAGILSISLVRGGGDLGTTFPRRIDTVTTGI
eukprot:IDg15810t1